jgi:hypothetical protein
MQVYTRHECYSSSDVNLCFSRSGANALEITLSGTMTFCYALQCTVLCAQEQGCSPYCLCAAVRDVNCWFPCLAAVAPLQMSPGLQGGMWGAVSGPAELPLGGGPAYCQAYPAAVPLIWGAECWLWGCAQHVVALPFSSL